jgi:hypothetical protein
VIEDAVTELIFDPEDSDIARGGGLRAGRYRIDGEGTLVLDGVSYVPGVTVSGRIEELGSRRQHGLLRVSGRTAAPGLLRVRRERVGGRLGGRRVRTTLGAGSAVSALAATRDRVPVLGR